MGLIMATTNRNSASDGALCRSRKTAPVGKASAKAKFCMKKTYRAFYDLRNLFNPTIDRSVIYLSWAENKLLHIISLFHVC